MQKYGSFSYRANYLQKSHPPHSFREYGILEFSRVALRFSSVMTAVGN